MLSWWELCLIRSCHILGIHKATWLLACCTLKDFHVWPLKHTMDVWCWCFSICVWQHISNPRGTLMVHQVLKWLMLHLLLERCVAGSMQWSERGGTWRGLKLIRFTIMGSVFWKHISDWGWSRCWMAHEGGSIFQNYTWCITCWKIWNFH